MFDLKYQQQKIKVGQRSIQTYSFGRGKRMVLAFPSFPHSGLYFRWLLAEHDLADFTFVVFDLPGWIGKSDGYEKKDHFSIEKTLEISQKVIDHYTPNSFSIIGFSFGAALALELAASCPQRIEKIVLVSPTVNILGSGSLKFSWGSKILKRLGLGWPLKVLILRRFNYYQKELKNSPIAPFLKDYRRMIKQADNRVLLESLWLVFYRDFLPCLDFLSGKNILVVSSRREDKVFRKQAEMIRRRLKGEKSMFLESGHADFMLKPDDEAVAHILDFLKG